MCKEQKMTEKRSKIASVSSVRLNKKE